VSLSAFVLFDHLFIK